MTVSILWRSEGCLHLASDSRMSFGKAGASDIGVKVMRLPICILGCDVDENGALKTLFAQTYGFAFAGSLSNAATFKQFIEDILLNVQYVDTGTPLSFERICDFLCHFSQLISTELVSRLAEHGQYTFLLAGYCPLAQRFRGARFILTQHEGHSVASFEEVAQKNGQYVAVGSGKAEFERLIAGQTVTWNSVLLSLNQVIDEAVVNSVGGDIQYGTFKSDRNFSVAGITRISVEEADDGERHYGPSTERVFKYRGFQIYEGWNMPENKFWPSPTFFELEVPSNKESAQRFFDGCRALIAETESK